MYIARSCRMGALVLLAFAGSGCIDTTRPVGGLVRGEPIGRTPDRYLSNLPDLVAEQPELDGVDVACEHLWIRVVVRNAGGVQSPPYSVEAKVTLWAHGAPGTLPRITRQLSPIGAGITVRESFGPFAIPAGLGPAIRSLMVEESVDPPMPGSPAGTVIEANEQNNTSQERFDAMCR